jgi:hypothetical protein
MTLRKPSDTPALPGFPQVAASQSGRPQSAPRQAIAADTTIARVALPLPAALYLLTVVLPVWFQAGPLAMSTMRILLLILVVPLLVQLLMGRFGKILATDYLFFLHFLWMIVSLGITSPDRVIEQSGSLGVEFLGGYLVGRAYIRSVPVFVALCRWLVVLVLFLLPFALYEAWTGWPLIVGYIQQIPGISSIEIVSIGERMGLERVQSTFAHPIHYGLFCSVAFSLAFVALKDISATGWRYVSSTLVGLSGFLALSSGALLAMLMQLFLIAWSSVFKTFERRWWLLVGLFALGWVVVELLSNRSALRVFMSYATFSAHNAYWRALIFEWGVKNVLGDAANNIPSAFWVGIGMGDWVRPSFMHTGSVDNFWLVIAMRFGVPGLIFLALGYIMALFRVMRRDFKADARLSLIRRAWVFTFLGLSFTLCTVHVWGSAYSFVFFMLGSGLWLVHVPAEATEDVPETSRPTGSRTARLFALVRPAPAGGAVARAGSAAAPARSTTPPPAAADRAPGRATRFAQTHRRIALPEADT